MLKKAKDTKKTMVKDEIRQSVTFKSNLYNISQKKAERLGLSYPDYLRYLVIRDNEHILTQDIPIEYLSDEQDAELAKSLDDIKNGRVHKFTTGSEFINYLNSLDEV